MNIRKLEDLSKDELISFIDESPDNPSPFLLYTESGDCHVGYFEGGDWFDHNGFYIENPTHWLPIPEIEE